MGTVKPTYIKTIAGDLIKEHPDTFTKDFDENKRLVSRFTNITSKKIRNRVAGYITRRANRNRLEV